MRNEIQKILSIEEFLKQVEWQVFWLLCPFNAFPSHDSGQWPGLLKGFPFLFRKEQSYSGGTALDSHEVPYYVLSDATTTDDNFIEQKPVKIIVV